MKKKFGSFRSTLLTAGSIFLLAILFSACKKDSDINNNTAAAGLMGFNLAPDKASIGLALSGSSLTNVPLNFTSYTGLYQTIFPGSREVAAYDFGSSTAFATTTQNFEAKKYYSVFTIGNNGTYANLVVEDKLDTLSAAAGQAYVRYVNAIPDSTKPAVTLTASGTDVSNSNAAYASVSEFLGVNPGDIMIKVANGSNISASRTITLEKNKVYTVLLVGVPGATDTAKQVQIKFISNGTIQ